ncbi:hypothetical protein PMY09_18050 [Clostridium tertium]|uniref:hypothetical protein n=1 Tax=Clostridium tertium TaxID=1559 RepID=UPI000C06D48A|nr:hypothetical protein [Clostridium tertium]MDB1956882.1 hypothetical protein [Clostridium tertium]MDB1963185.1 hypothetical protein [Clostridium tertium]MDB1967863.1 hypothetical protein [Clostridium tertium]
MFKFTYEECKLTFIRIYKRTQQSLNQKYYCRRFAEIHHITLSKHKEVIEHYNRFVKELEGDEKNE